MQDYTKDVTIHIIIADCWPIRIAIIIIISVWILWGQTYVSLL